ncbi:hypothetical protein [Streptomyces sp. CBMA123]|uniref:hypothetical protein n=1 Tax=Streptomyces sp. CBMA123 TaxID=1896313 RepID=UPI001661AF60|nr:hypothetical protein [Streptomyces sp. CBMA123]MBD0691643.1 hypothetical protein [Streptomyces sp. CBMA123]
MADSDDSQASAQMWGAVMVVGAALAVVAAYLIKGPPLVLAVAGIETLLLMAYVGRRWRAMHRQASPAGHRPRRGIPDAAHCERCRRAREALDARRARGRMVPAAWAVRPEVESELPGSSEALESAEALHSPQATRTTRATQATQATQSTSDGAEHPSYPHRAQGRAGYERPWTAERAATRSTDRTTARRGTPGSAGRAVRHQ